MRGREKNSAFFKNDKLTGNSDIGSGGLSGVYKNARASGKLVLSARSLTTAPDGIFSLSTSLEEGEKFWEMNPLTKLDLGSNLLTCLPHGKFDLLKVDLAYLQLKDNRINALPDDLFSCNALQYLNLSINALTGINESIGDLTDLRELFVANNKLLSIPSSLASCKSLQTLELQNNALARIPNGSLMLPQLLKLDLSSNKLTEIPSCISELLLLETLDISKNKLDCVPDLSKMKSLKLLSASNNKISRMPLLPTKGVLDRVYLGENVLKELDMESLTRSAGSITELLVQGNQLTVCPDGIYALSRLKVLDMSNNCLTNLPPTLGYMTSLQKILMEGNSIRTIRRPLLSSPVAEELKVYLRTRGPAPLEHSGGAGEGSVEDAWQASYSAAAVEELAGQLQWRTRDCTGNSLDLSGISITSNSMSIVYRSLQNSHTFGTLHTLNLSNNSLSSFPGQLRGLLALKKLILAGNSLGSAESDSNSYTVPQTLISLDVSSNKVTSAYLDDLLTALNSQGVQLSELLCSVNRLSDIPRSITEQTNLREIRMSYNQISTLKGLQLSYLSRLEILDLSSNKIPRLDVTFPFSLSTLMLANNNITELPTNLTALSNLQTLQLTGNPIKSIRPEAISMGVEGIFPVLRHRVSSSSTAQGGTRGRKDEEVVRKAPVRRPVEKTGWNEDVATEDMQGQSAAEQVPSHGALEQYRSGSSDQGARGHPGDRDNLDRVRGDSRQGSFSSEDVRTAYVSETVRTRVDSRFDPRVKELDRLEDELSACSNALKKMQLRRDISSLRAQMGPR